MNVEKVGAYLASLRRGRGMTQQQVADILHISRSYVSRIEKKALEELRAMMRKGASAGKG